MPSNIQRSFAGGELAPALFGRSDQTKYQSGLRKCENFLVMRHGGVSNRPGTKFIAQAKDSARKVRLIKFVFNAEQTYVLEFGHQYVRFIRNAVQLTVNGAPYEIATPYLEEHLRDIQHVQSGDVITLVHPLYVPRQLARSGHTNWSLSLINYSPSVNPPPFLQITGTAGTAAEYVTTAVKEITYEESIPSAVVGNTNGSPSSSSKNIITIGAVSGIYEFSVYKKKNGVFGFIGTARSPLNPKTCNFTAINSPTKTVTLTLPTGHGYDVGEPIILTDASFAALNNIWTVATTAATTVTFLANGIGTLPASGTVTVNFNALFSDDGITPDVNDTPPQARNPFDSANNYPGAVSYFQQRAVFASTTSEPEKVWMSRSGNFKNFTIRSPLQDDDAVTFTIAGRQVNAVRHMVEVGTLIILTSGGEWRVMGDADGVIKPSAINLKQEGYNGSSTLTPIVIGNNALYVQARGNIARDLRYDLQTDGYTGRDLTVFAAHMFDGYQLVNWDYAQIPHSIVWVVRNDGQLLGLTYVREHDVWGWHRHTTDGFFEDVVCVPEGTEDVIYVVVRRQIGGQWRRYIERFSPRYTSQVIDVSRDAFFLDCGATYDGRNSGSTLLAVSEESGLTVRDTQILQASAALFNIYDVGNAYELTASGATIRFKVLEYIDAQQVRVQPSRNLSQDFVGVGTTAWTRMVDGLLGLDHLEGKEVSILADGNVHPARTVVEGQITLDRAYGVIHVGLAYTSILQTLTIDNPGGETLMDKNKLIAKVSMMVDSSRGVLAGPDENNLREYKQRRTESYGEAVRQLTGLVEVQTVSQWDKNGQICVVQKDPLPLSILSIVPQVSVSPR